MQIINFRVSKNNYLAQWLIVIAVLFIVYGMGLKYPFQFDDVANISKNFSIRALDIGSQWMVHSRWFGEWLNRLTFQFAAFEPFYYRLLSLLTHLSMAVAWLYLIKFLCAQQKKSLFLNQYAEQVGLLSAAFFLLHPVQSQTVCYVIQARLEGFASLLTLCSLNFFMRSLVIEVEVLWKRFYLGLACFLIFLACSTKEIAIVAPFLAFMCDLYWISDFSWMRLKKNLIYHFLFGLVTFGVVIYFLKFKFVHQVLSMSAQSFNNRGNILTQSPTELISAYKFLISQFIVILHYLKIFVWPVNLCVEYDYVLESSFWSLPVVLPFIILAGFTLGFFWMMTKPNLRPFSFGYFWFLISIAPRASIIPSAELACDYKTYLGSFGVLWMIAYVLTYFLKPDFLEKDFLAFVNKNLILLLLLTVLTGMTFSRIRVWQNGIVFWQDIVNKNPDRPRPLNNLGVALTEGGLYDEAIIKFKRAIALDGYYPDPLSNIAVVYSMKGMYPEAVRALEQAIRIIPNYPEAFNNLAAMHIKCKNTDKAIPALEEAVRLRPHYGKAHFNLGRCYLDKGDKLKAWECFKAAVEGDLDSYEGLSAYGQVSLMVDKLDVAIKVFQDLLKKGDKSFDTSFNLANALHLSGDVLQAEKVYRRLIEDFPQDPRPRFNLGENLFSQEKFSEAYQHFILFEEAFTSYPQALLRAAHCLEKTVGLEKELELLERNKHKSFEDSFRETLKNELGRVRLQIKINAGQGSVTMNDLEKLFSI